jgi:hypothetical protein
MTLDPASWLTVVSLAASIVTILAFVASIWFFLSGTRLQRDAQDALSRIESLASAINDRTGENFTRLLDAVAGAKESVAEVVPPGSPNSAKVQETFDDLTKKIRKEAADFVVGYRAPRSVKGRPPDPETFKHWLKKTREQEENEQREFQDLVNTMKEVGPLTPAELGMLTPISLQDLEDRGVIEFVNGRWVPNKKWLR